MTKDNLYKAIALNKDMFGRSILTRKEKPVKVLQYPLSPVPLSICNADGKMQSTNKNDLMNLVLKCKSSENQRITKLSNIVFIADLRHW